MAYRYRTLLSRATVVLALGVVSAACGGSTNQTSATTAAAGSTTTGATASSSSTTTVDRTQVLMRAGLLGVGDLPSTWKDSGKSSAASASDQTQLELAKTIPGCRDFAQTVGRENQQPKASSNTFVDAAASVTARGQVSNDVVAWPTVADAKTAFTVYSASNMKGCLDTLFRKIVSQQAAGTQLKVTTSVENLAVPSVGDAAIGYQAVVSLASSTTSQQIGFIIEIVRVGRYTVSYNATLYEAAPSGFGKNLVVRSIARLEAAPPS